jgi:hypothetical protein
MLELRKQVNESAMSIDVRKHLFILAKAYCNKCIEGLNCLSDRLQEEYREKAKDTIY